MQPGGFIDGRQPGRQRVRRCRQIADVQGRIVVRHVVTGGIQEPLRLAVPGRRQLILRLAQPLGHRRGRSHGLPHVGDRGVKGLRHGLQLRWHAAQGRRQTRHNGVNRLKGRLFARGAEVGFCLAQAFRHRRGHVAGGQRIPRKGDGLAVLRVQGAERVAEGRAAFRQVRQDRNDILQERAGVGDTLERGRQVIQGAEGPVGDDRVGIFV